MVERQFCKVCGKRDKFDFHVPNELWFRIVPEAYHKNVVCIACFDSFALARGIDYVQELKEVYFAGDRGIAIFTLAKAIPGETWQLEE